MRQGEGERVRGRAFQGEQHPQRQHDVFQASVAGSPKKGGSRWRRQKRWAMARSLDFRFLCGGKLLEGFKPEKEKETRLDLV